MREVLKLPGKNGFTAPVPEFGLRLMLGEMADAVLQSTRTLPKRLEAEGFEWRFARTPEMLRDLYGIDQ
jgi:NAD dependent epimerase/dehydratase family enzyme